MTAPFVPDDFDVPAGLDLGWCRLEPLDVAHNESDFVAWHDSVEHIHATPGFPDGKWPRHDYTLEQNAADLERHHGDFVARRGFTYTVREPGGEVIGCVYIYPAEGGGPTDVRSWVRAADADRDADLYRGVRQWLADAWPFTDVAYAERPPPA